MVVIDRAHCKLHAITHMPAGQRNAMWRNIQGTDAQTQISGSSLKLTPKRVQQHFNDENLFFFSPSLFSFNTVPAADFGPSLSPSILTELRGKARELGSAGDVRRSILCFFLSPPHAWELCRRMEATDKTEAEVWSWWELKSYITKEIQKCASDGREKFHSFRTRILILLFDLGWYWTENIFPISQSKQIE